MFWASGLQVVPCLSHIGDEDSSLTDAGLKGLNKGVLILSDLELPALPCISPITAISGYQNINCIRCRNRPVALWEGDLSCAKVYEGPLGYAEGSLLTLCNHFIQLYRTLHTLFSEYH